MKKKYLSILVLLVYMSSFAFVPAQAESVQLPVIFAEAEHQRNEGYPAQFKTYRAQDELIGLSIQQNIYESESAGILWNKASEDIHMIRNTLGTQLHKTEIYIVPQTLNGLIQVIGNRVYSTAEDVLSGQYREALLAAVLGTDEPWLAIGLTAYVFGTKPDDDMLVGYYSHAESLNILSLFAAYFNDAFADEAERGIAEATAASLSRYVIETYGLDELLKQGKTYVQPWLASLGINREYDNPYSGSFSRYRYTATKDYPLVVISTRGDEFYFPVLEGLIETPRQIEDILFENTQSEKVILSYLEEHAPEYFEEIKRNYSEPIFYYFNDDHDYHVADRGRRVHVNPSVIIHAMIHVMIPPPKGIPSLWPYESIVVYLNSEVYPSKAERIRFFNVLTADFDGDSADDQIARLTQQIYKKHAEMPANRDDLDVLLFTKSVVAAAMLLPHLKSESPLLTVTFREWRKRQFSSGEEGSDLTYPQAASFGDYLVRNYGLSSLIRLCLEPGVDFQDVYGVRFNVMRKLWTNEVLNNSL